MISSVPRVRLKDQVKACLLPSKIIRPMAIRTSEFSNPCSLFCDSTDLSLKCEGSKALSLQTCDFFKRSLEAISA